MSTPDEITRLVTEHGLLILTPLALLEGPVVTAIGAWLASLGLLDIRAVLVCVILADLAGDCLTYAAGRWLPGRVSPRLAARLGLGRARMARLMRAFRAKGGRIIVMGKLTHAAGFAVLLAAGMAKMPFWRFFAINFLATLPKSLAIAAIGYSFGAAIDLIRQGFAVWTLAGLAVLAVWLGLRLFRKTPATVKI